MDFQQELDIRKYLQLVYKKRYAFILAALSIMTVAIAGSYLKPKVYEAKSIVFIERDFLHVLIKDITVTQSVEEQLRALSIVMKSRRLLLKVIEDLEMNVLGKGAAELEKIVRSLQAKTEINVVINKRNRRDMDLFTVSYASKNPEFARDYVNALVKRYIEDNLSAMREQAYGANRFLSEQIHFFKEKLDKVNAEIAHYEMRTGALSDEKMLALKKRRNELLVQYTRNHPEVLRVNAMIASLSRPRGNGPTTGDAVASVDPGGANQRAGLESSENGSVGSESRGEKTLSNLEKERDTYSKIYEELTATLGKSEVSTHLEFQDKAGAFSVLEPALLPTNPLGPSMMKMLLLCILAGIAGGFGFVFLLDYLDNSVKTVDALKGFGVSVLAVIPSIKNPEELLMRKRKDSLIYSAAALYIIGILGIVVREFLG